MQPRFDLVVAADLDWGIGRDNALPWPKLSQDLRHFRRITTAAPGAAASAIVMGRRTWQSAEVGARPLPNRINCVITRGQLAAPTSVRVAHSLPDAFARCADASAIYVVGGAQIYRDAVQLPNLRYIYLTRVLARFACDTHLPDLDIEFSVDTSWAEAAQHEENGVRYRIERLQRNTE